MLNVFSIAVFSEMPRGVQTKYTMNKQEVKSVSGRMSLANMAAHKRTANHLHNSCCNYRLLPPKSHLAVPGVSLGRVVEPSIEANLLSQSTFKCVFADMIAKRAPSHKNSMVSLRAPCKRFNDVIFGTSTLAPGTLRQAYSEVQPCSFSSHWSLQAWLLINASFIWTINTTVSVDIAFCHAALSLCSSQFYQAVNWIPFGLTVLIIILW